MKKGLVTILLLPIVSSALAAGDIEAGAKIATTICVACHGNGGVSANPEWPNLAGQGEKYLLKQLHDFKSGDRANAIMAGQVAALSEQDMQNLAAYFAAQKPAPAATQGAGEHPDEMLAFAEQLYRGGDMQTGVPACLACHGPSGTGIEPAAFPRLSAQHAKYTRNQLEAFSRAAHASEQATDAESSAEQRANDPNEMMRDIAGKMTPKQIEAISYYVQGLH